MKRLLIISISFLLFFQQMNAQINAGPDHIICQGETVNLFAVATGGYGTDSYSFEVFPFQPETYTGGTPVTFGGNQDDQIAGPFTIGFDFCFFNQFYSQFYIGSNGWVGFTSNTSWTTYTSAPIPSTSSSVPKNCIMAPWQDWHPGVSSAFGPPHVFYKTIGTAPNRKLVIYWYECPMFSCTSNRGTFQIVLNEQSSIIENHITNKPACVSWAGGTATQGVHNANGTVAFTATGRNSTQWTASNESTRFVPSGIKWYVNGYPNGTIVGYGPELIVTPQVTTVYTAVVTLCGGQVHTDDVLITVNPQDDATFGYGSSTLCQNGYSGNPVTPTPGGLYVSTPPGLSINPSTGNINLGSSAPGAYSITHYTTGACPDTASITVTVVTSPSAAFGYPASSYCNNSGNPVPVFPPGSSAGTFTAAPPGLVFVSNLTGEINLQQSQPGEYMVTNTIPPSAACPQSSHSVQLTINPLPPAPGNITGPSSLCENPLNSVFTITPVQFTTSYQWGLAPPAAGAISGNGTSATVNWADNYIGSAHIQVRGVNACGQGQPSAPFTVNINPLPKETGTPVGPALLCQGAGLTQYYTSGSAFAEYYQWEIIPATAGAANGQGQQITVSWSASYSGTAGLRVRGMNECGSSVWSDALQVELQPLPVQASQPFGPDLLCAGEVSSGYTVLPVGGASSYNWKIEPASAGNILPSLNTAQVNWSPGFAGVAAISVCAVNSCGQGAFSIPLLVEIAPNPLVNAGNDTTVLHGSQIVLKGVVSGINQPALISWEPAALLENANVLQPLTLPLEYTVAFTMTAEDAQTGCAASDQLWVEVQGSPLAAAASADDVAFCRGGGTFLRALAFGGNGNYQFSWFLNGQLFSSLQEVYVEPEISTQYQVVVFDGIDQVSAYVNITVHQLPLADAGTDVNILLGFQAQLTGSASPPGNYSYSWQPADSLIDATVANPLTVPLFTANLFTLTVTDANGCVSLPDAVTVYTQGGILLASPVVVPDVICAGDTATLFAMPSGGLSTAYVCQWHKGAELVAEGLQAMVYPDVSTEYTLNVSDGFSSIQRQVNLTVNPLPHLQMQSEGYAFVNDAFYACVFDTLVIRTGSSNADWLWSNGSVADSIFQLASGISFDLRDLWVRVTDKTTSCVSFQRFLIYFTFSNCSYGLPENNRADDVVLYPNPTGNIIIIRSTDPLNSVNSVQLFDLQGKLFETSINSKHTESLMLDVKHLATGMYFAVIHTENGICYRKVLVVKE